MRNAAADLAFEGERRGHRPRPNARLRDDPQGSAQPEIKRMKLMDLEFADEVLTTEGEEVDKSAPKRWRAAREGWTRRAFAARATPSGLPPHPMPSFPQEGFHHG